MYETETNMFKILSDPTRIQLLRLLIEGETCGCTLIDKVAVSQPTLSYHLNLLAKYGLATKSVEGNKHNYHVDKDAIRHLQAFLQELLDSTPSTCEVTP